MKKTTRALAVLGVVAGLGVAALPLGAYAETSQSVTVKTTIEPVLSIEVKADADTALTDDTILLGDAGATGSGKIMNNTSASRDSYVLVKCNNPSGYTANIKDADATVNLVGETDTNVIAPITTPAAALPTSGDSAWGYKTTVDGTKVTNGVENWTGITESNVAIAKSATATNVDGDHFTLSFGVYAASNQAADTYSDIVTVSVAANM